MEQEKKALLEQAGIDLEEAAAKQKRHVDPDGTRATAARTGVRVLGRHRSRAATVVARLVATILDALANTLLHLVGCELNIHNHVRPRLGIVRRASATPAGLLCPRTAEGEAAAKGRAIASSVTTRATGIGRCGTARERIARTHRIVPGTLLLIGEHSIRLRNLFKALLGIGSFVHIGMQLARLLLKGPLDILLRGVLINAKNRVIVFFIHGCHKAEKPPAWYGQ